VNNARAEFRLNTQATVTVDEDHICVRAQAILAAHAELKTANLSAEDEAVLRAVVRRAKNARLKNYENYPVEVSPYVAALLRLEA
jgi:uncharacterized protein YcfL